MAVTDPIGDFLTSIRNASKARKENVTVIGSTMKVRIAEILKEEGFVKNVKVVQDGAKKFIRIYLKYLKGNKPAIKGLKRISTPGLRLYTESENMPRVFSGLGIVVVSTSRGVMTGDQARRDNLGGELVCKVW